MELIFAKNLDLFIRKTNISIEKIDNIRLKTFEMLILSFSLNDIDENSQFFKKTILFVNISIDITFKIVFFTLSNIKIDFNDEKYLWKVYITIKALFITKGVELVRK